MPFNETLLQENHNLVKLSVLSSTQISNRTSAVISNLQAENSSTSTPAIVALTAKSKATSKLITIAEIVKRELAEKNVKCFQYNALSSEMVRIPSKKAEADDESDEEAFEAMDGAIGTDRKRKMPVMTVYLSTVPVRELRSAYGEQT